MKFITNFFNKIWQNGVPLIIVLFLSVGYFLIWLSHDKNNLITDILPNLKLNLGLVQTLKDAANIFGQAIIFSGVATTILKANFFTNILQEQLFKVVYSDELLKNRRDIDDIWNRVSKTLYANKFPEIADSINKTITKKYFPTEKNYYYHKIENSLKFEVIDKLNKIVKTTETLSGIIVLHRNFFSRINPWDKMSEIKVIGDFDKHPDPAIDKTKLTVSEGQFNSKIICADLTEKNSDASKYRYEFVFNLKEIVENTIKFNYTVEKTYHLTNPLDTTNNISRNLHHDYTLYINYEPKDLIIRFIDIGTADNYHDINKNCPPGQIAKKNDGVIFPGQGYSLVLQII